MIDKSLSFGMQNFLFLQSDETDGTYNYYAYMDKKGAIILMRTDKTASVALYWYGVGTYATIWAAKALQTYALPNTLTDPTV